MWWNSLKWLFFGVAVTMLSNNVNVCKAAPSPRNEDMFRELMKLDQLYSSVARPSLRSVPMTPDVGPKVQRALNMLRLQELDRMYADRARPRFGKRTMNNPGSNSKLIPNLDYNNQYQRDPDAEEWLVLKR